MMLQMILITALAAPVAHGQNDSWKLAEANAEQSQRSLKFCLSYMQGWLSHADPATGLLPRTVSAPKSNLWNAQDCAADNYPFMVLTAYMTDQYHLKLIVHSMLEQERKLTCRLDSLPDDYLFDRQGFGEDDYDLNKLIFGASEYAKDGLMPITEWLGPSPWLNRMQELIRDIWKHAPVTTEAGMIPSENVEVNGELLQVMSRLYWLTGETQYRDWVFRLADYYLLHHSLLELDELKLVDHGCEITGGLSEAYVIAARTDAAKWHQYKPAMHALLDYILDHATNDDGLLYWSINPKTDKLIRPVLSDTWGYVYNAFLTVAEVDSHERYREAVRHVLSNIHKYYCRMVTRLQGADSHADAIEGAINLLNRIGVSSAFNWVDREINYIFDVQRHDGIIEGWYGDGNSARTVWMYALWKTRGITASPWREDLQLGAVQEHDGTLKVFVKSEWPWQGLLRFDHPRHKDFFHMPIDYPRINQFPEWFTVQAGQRYLVTQKEITEDESEEKTPSPTPVELDGKSLLYYELSLNMDRPVHITIKDIKDK